MDDHGEGESLGYGLYQFQFELTVHLKRVYFFCLQLTNPDNSRRILYLIKIAFSFKLIDPMYISNIFLIKHDKKDLSVPLFFIFQNFRQFYCI